MTKMNGIVPKIDSVKTFVTFGQTHIHKVNGKVFDKDCVAVINHSPNLDGNQVAFEYFGSRFSNAYPEKFFRYDSVKLYPRGIIELEN